MPPSLKPNRPHRRNPRHHQRGQQQENQRERIQGGVKNGSLTRKEAAKMRHRVGETHQEIKEAKADGVVTHEERADIKQDQKQTSKAIYRQKHDGQRRRRG